MKVALVHDFLVKMGGAERVLKVLCEMFPDAPVYTLIYDEKTCGSIFPADKVRPSVLQKLSRFFGHRVLAPFYPAAVEQWDFSGFDLVISLSNSYAHGVVTPLDTKHICYCHSPMRYAWDWTNEYRKEQGFSGFKNALWTYFLNRLRMWDRMASERPDLYIANSKNVANRIWKYYRRKAKVVHPPVDIERFKVSKKHEDYFLIISTLTPYKRVDLAVEFFNERSEKLVVIGDGAQRSYLKSIAGPNVEILGRKSDKVVSEYLANCKALIFPGEEDFGITPLEAMASGKPVLAYRKGGVLESVIEGKTGEFFDNPDLVSMGEGFKRLISNYDKYEPAILREQAEKFSGERFVEEVSQSI